MRILVLDDSGQPLSTATKDSITVQFDKQTAEVRTLQPLAAEPLYFSMLVDTSGSARPTTDAQIIANVRLFRILSSGSQNHGFVVLFNDDIANPGDGVTTPRELDAQLRKAEYHGSTALYDAIEYACTTQLSTAKLPINARRAIVVISDGVDNSSRATLKHMIATAQREGVPIFSVVLSVDRKHKKEGSKGLKALGVISESTGGLTAVVEQLDELDRLMAHIMEGQYLLAVKKPPVKKAYALSIASTQAGAHVLAAREFVAQ